MPWQPLGPAEMAAFALEWLSELRGDSSGSDTGQAVVMMNFLAPPEQQWEFILTAISLADSDDELAHIAAGPIEHLLGKHGARYIKRVELEASRDRKFGRALTAAWQHRMSDEIWARVRALQAQVPDPISPSRE